MTSVPVGGFHPLCPLERCGIPPPSAAPGIHARARHLPPGMHHSPHARPSTRKPAGDNGLGASTRSRGGGSKPPPVLPDPGGKPRTRVGAADGPLPQFHPRRHVPRRSVRRPPETGSAAGLTRARPSFFDPHSGGHGPSPVARDPCLLVRKKFHSLSPSPPPEGGERAILICHNRFFINSFRVSFINSQEKFS